MYTPLTKKFRFITVDDEPVSLNGINCLLARDPEVDLVASCDNGLDAVKKINELRPDVLLLDVQMAGIDGFEVLERLHPGVNPVVMFITAYDSYALKAFDANAMAYILKPFNDETFFKKIERAKNLCQQEKNQKAVQHLLLQNLGEQTADRIIIKDKGEIIFLQVNDIHWIDADDYQVNVQTPYKLYLIRESISNLEKRLNPNKFIRIHRSTIVNIDQIKSIQPYFESDYVAVMRDGKKFRISRSRKEKIKQQFAL